MEEQKIKLGDIVSLKSGSPSMTVEYVETASETAACVWFVNSELKRGEFRVTSLKITGDGPFTF